MSEQTKRYATITSFKLIIQQFYQPNRCVHQTHSQDIYRYEEHRYACSVLWEKGTFSESHKINVRNRAFSAIACEPLPLWVQLLICKQPDFRQPNLIIPSHSPNRWLFVCLFWRYCETFHSQEFLCVLQKFERRNAWTVKNSPQWTKQTNVYCVCG